MSGVQRPRLQRRYPRLTLRVDVEIEWSEGAAEAVATTLGAGGLFIGAEIPVVPGTSLKLRFRLPERDALHVLEGRVIWCTEPGETHRSPGVGVEFVDPDSRARLAVELEHWAAKRETRRASTP